MIECVQSLLWVELLVKFGHDFSTLFEAHEGVFVRKSLVESEWIA